MEKRRVWELRCVRFDSVIEEVSGTKGVCDFQWDRMRVFWVSEKHGGSATKEARVVGACGVVLESCVDGEVNCYTRNRLLNVDR